MVPRATNKVLYSCCFCGKKDFTLSVVKSNKYMYQACILCARKMRLQSTFNDLLIDTINRVVRYQGQELSFDYVLDYRERVPDVVYQGVYNAAVRKAN